MMPTGTPQKPVSVQYAPVWYPTPSEHAPMPDGDVWFDKSYLALRLSLMFGRLVRKSMRAQKWRRRTKAFNRAFRNVPAIAALILQLTGCDALGLGPDRIAAFGDAYIQERQGQETLLLRGGEIRICVRPPVGTITREYGGTAVLEPWRSFCDAVRELREPARPGVVLP